MLHHLSLGVADIERSVAFYDAALSALGYVRVWSDLTPQAHDAAAGYGYAGGGDKFALKARPDATRATGAGLHVAFAAPSRGAVVEFHRLALQTGGEDNGPPGLRFRYGKNYYAAFVIDPDGHRIEAVIS